MALAAGDAWLNNSANLLLFGPPGGGKSHLAAALGFALVENGWRVLGGINWSSQHNRGECCDGRKTAVGSSVTGQVEVARAAGDGAT
jgi:hypothetical protein